MLSEKLKNYNIILASGSPRRQRFFKEMDINFTIQLKETE
jgi:septum formation protein